MRGVVPPSYWIYEVTVRSTPPAVIETVDGSTSCGLSAVALIEGVCTVASGFTANEFPPWKARADGLSAPDPAAAVRRVRMLWYTTPLRWLPLSVDSV